MAQRWDIKFRVYESIHIHQSLVLCCPTGFVVFIAALPLGVFALKAFMGTRPSSLSPENVFLACRVCRVLAHYDLIQPCHASQK